MKKWFAVIGDPIAHSKSPEMHNAWFTELGIDATYIPLHVTEENLAAAITSLRVLGSSGFNVTIPHKEKIIPYLDELDPLAKKMGAVNTVVRLADGRLKGYNTDGLGFLRSLEMVTGHKPEAKVVLLGAGGAARGIAFAMAQAGYTLTIANRTVARAQAIIDELGRGEAMALSDVDASAYDIIIQTTSAGLSADFALPIDVSRLRKEAFVADIVYNPLVTPFLRAAQKQGATIINGVGMFVNQGAIAFNHWLDVMPDTKSMIASIEEQLGGN